MEVPPLRARREDVPLLVEHFLERYAREYGRSPKMLHPAAMEALMRYSWPGNVRELRNVVERLVILAPGESIGLADLPGRLASDSSPAFDPTSPAATLHQGRRAFEKRMIQERLQAMSGNISRTAESLGIERSNLYRKMKAYGIHPESQRR